MPAAQEVSVPLEPQPAVVSRLRPPRRRWAGVVATLAVTAVITPAAPARAEPEVITVTVDAAATGGRVLPQNFLGLSWEADQLHQPWMGADTGNLAALLRDLGPGTLRFSANAVDRTPWQHDAPAEVPGPVITAADLTRVGRLAREIGWPVDLGVNLGANDPTAAADEIRTAQQAMGSMLRSVQIGNEPDVFPMTQLKPYDQHTYLDQVRAYRAAVDAAAPGLRYGGPDTAMAAPASVVGATLEPRARAFRSAYLDAFGQNGDFLDQHYYPLFRTPGANPADMVDQLNSTDTADRTRRFIDDIVHEADTAGVEPHLSETNSVAGNGQPGVADTFGAALWTLDYLLTAASSGITGVDMHQQPQDCGSYAWVCLADGSGRLRAQPPFYAGLLMAQLRGGTFLPAQVSDPGAGVSAHAVRMPDGHITVVVADVARAAHRSVSVRVVGTGADTAAARWLTGPSPYATADVRFAGAEVAADGTFTPAPPQRVSATAGAFGLDFDGPAAVVLAV
ncbi:hypothetical protein AB0L57_01230 [Nocardia sp. NPDC052254]|uniref:hypothetical protein n=1 Tax=Nocardia sp. NPDC052254 TaxID=3155681 RepID=UPI0034461460